jgi:type IV secretion system protein VirB4
MRGTSTITRSRRATGCSCSSSICAGLLFETADTDEINYRKVLRDAMLQAIGSSRFALYTMSSAARPRSSCRRSSRTNSPASSTRRGGRGWRPGKLLRQRPVPDADPPPLQGRSASPIGARRLRTGRPLRLRRTSANELRQLDGARDALLAQLGSYAPRLLGVYETKQGVCSEPLEFLSALYNGEMRPVLMPMQDAGSYIPYRRVSFGEETVELGPAGNTARGFVGMVSIKDYPAQTAPGMLDELLRLPFELTVSQSLRLRRSPGGARQDESRAAPHALGRGRGREPARRAVQRQGRGRGRTCGFRRASHMTIAVRGDTPGAVDAGVAEVQASLADLGIIAVREEIALEPAFWAQFPGNFKYIAGAG